MLGNTLLYFAHLILKLLIAIATGTNFLIPQSATNAISYILNYTVYVQGFFPVATLMEALGNFMIFLYSYYIIKIVIYTYAMLPKVGSGVRLNLHNKP